MFFLLFMLFQLQTAQQNKKSIEQKAEVVVEMEWDPKSTDDMDLWMLLPGGKRVGYSSKDQGIAVLDRDDRGAYGDTYTDPLTGEKKIIEVNKEIITIRAIIPGKYVVNAHYFAHISVDAKVDDSWAKEIAVNFKLTDINPVFKEVAHGTRSLTRPGDQVTLVSFELTPDGQVTNINTEDQIPFIQQGLNGQ
jgi:uncharacterized protein YfaP (DUF2135 family)